ncbi:acyltransferase domain-containing protein [Amycolatopsis sp. lyj-90]|uniref:ACP S-malonyltransferase n=1 Tax=Amycolatopsis sp. lyj-90 TaxID=2789285 RepID=UPI00397C136B
MSRHHSRSVFLFPGQGGYTPGIFAATAETDPAVTRVLTDVDRTATALGGPEVCELLTDRDAPSLTQLVTSDPARLHLAIFATEMAAYTQLTAGDTGPDLLVGHSFGEFAALTAAGCVDLHTGTSLVCQRDFALRAAGPVTGGMLSLSTGFRRAENLVAAVDDWHLALAADNGPDQVVVSGPHEALDRLAAVADAAGVSSRRLQIPYPFHNRILGDAAERFQSQLDDLKIVAPKTRVYSPTLSRYIETAEDAARVFSRHLLQPVRFLEAVRVVHSDGYRRFVECGARSILVDLVNTAVAGALTATPLRRRKAPDKAVPAIASDRNTVLPAEVPSDVPSAAPTPHVDLDPASASDVLRELRSLYAEAVGYPVDVFESGVELEADLGIDSIRQTELLNRALKKYEIPSLDVRITEYTTLEAVAALVSEQASAAAK